MYESILVPTDGSDASQRAVRHALSHAEQYDADVHVLHVVDVAQTTPVTGHASDIWDQLEEQGHAEVEAIVEQTEDLEQQVVGEVVCGQPAHEITLYADEHDIDLIVMGTHGRRGMTRLLVGSVTETVVRRSAVPVIAVPPAE